MEQHHPDLQRVSRDKGAALVVMCRQLQPSHPPAPLRWTPHLPQCPPVAARIGTSSDLRVGQSVYAIGNPAGLSHTLTVGSVSGLSRSIPSATGDRIFGAIQVRENKDSPPLTVSRCSTNNYESL